MDTPATNSDASTSRPADTEVSRKRPIWASLWFYVSILFVLVPICVILWLAIAGHPERQVHISAETTVITGPLTSQGLVDYAEALRRRHRDEVPADENAARLVAEALGPSVFGSSELAQLAYDQLELPLLPQSGDYRVSLHDLLTQQAANVGETYNTERFNELAELMTSCQQVPWSAEEQPDFAAWVAANELPLEKIHTASQMSLMRHPVLVAPGGALMEFLLPIAQELRDFGRLLTLRAMQRLNSGDPQAAWDDILALHRLARLQAQGDTLIEYLVACANFAVASNAMQALLSSPEMTPELLTRIQADWRALPKWRDVAEVVNTSERYLTLDVIQRTARFGPGYLSSMMGNGGTGGYPDNAVLTRAMNAMIDWDRVLIEANRWLDQVSAALGETDPARRDALIDQFETDVETLADETRSAWFPSTHNFGGKIISSMLPAVGGMHRAITTRDARQSLVDTALAIEQFRLDEGRVPASLAELVPEYLDAVPIDPHAPADKLHYLIQGDDAYVLYSVGDNGFDDGGVTENGDTAFRVRMPVPEWLQVGDATPAASPDPAAESQVQ